MRVRPNTALLTAIGLFLSITAHPIAPARSGASVQMFAGDGPNSDAGHLVLLKVMSDSEGEMKKVFWLGGSPCAGKSSIGEILAERFDLDLYHVDEAFETHAQGLDPVHQPALAKWCASSWNERWMQPIDNLVKDVIACYREHFALIYEDILAMPKRKSLLV